MEPLIPIINKLQDVFNSISHTLKSYPFNGSNLSFGLELPQLVVVGSQSSGKSSVLENIVGKDFLPRGTNIVTRCPLVLQLVHLRLPTTFNISSVHLPNPNPAQSHFLQSGASQQFYSCQGSGNLTPRISSVIDQSSNLRNESTLFSQNYPEGFEWGEFLHLPGQKFYDFHEICNEIERHTNQIAGENKGVSNVPIHLKIVSPFVVDLTLVDLPGITKIPVGDQPMNIEEQIRSLIHEYIKSENSLILAITPANMDIVNSEALKFAREVDPLGHRTIGVLTKLDLMDAGTNALDILLNKGPYRLQHGFIGVVCRSQQDIVNEKSIKSALMDEIAFFEKHHVYKCLTGKFMAVNKCDKIGTRYLVTELNCILINHIRKLIPTLKLQIQQGIEECQRQLMEFHYDEFENDEPVDERLLLLKCITKFTSDFIQSIQGSGLQSTANYPNFKIGRSFDASTSAGNIREGLVGGARLYALFHDKFTKIIQRLDAMTNLTEMDVYLAIKNSSGLRPSLFLPENSFEVLVKGQIQLLLEPCLLFLDEIFNEILYLLRLCADPRYPSGYDSDYTSIPSLPGKSFLSRFPVLKETILKRSEDLLKERLTPMKTMIHQYVGIESAYINTNHPDFMKASTAINNLTKYYESRKGNGRKNQHLSKKSSASQLNNSQFDSLSTLSLVDSRVSSSNQYDVTGVTSSVQQNTSFQGSTTSTSAGNASPSNNHGSILNYFFRGAASSTVQPTASPVTSFHKKLPSVNNNSHGAKPSLTSAASFNPISAIPPLSTHLPEDSVESSSGMGSSHRLPLRSNTSDLLNDKEEMEVQIILTLIHSYFNIVKNNVIDFVPKSIMYFILQYMMDNLQNVLVSSIYLNQTNGLGSGKAGEGTSLGELLKEDELLKFEKEALCKLLETYKKAKTILNEVHSSPDSLTA